jgi:hypothetical protein
MSLLMSAMGHQATLLGLAVMSGLPSTADIRRHDWHVR